jgi:hypothetical protein
METTARIVSEVHSHLGATVIGDEVAFIRAILMEEGDVVQLRLYSVMSQVCKKCTGSRGAGGRERTLSFFLDPALRAAALSRPGIYFLERAGYTPRPSNPLIPPNSLIVGRRNPRG